MVNISFLHHNDNKKYLNVFSRIPFYNCLPAHNSYTGTLNKQIPLLLGQVNYLELSKFTICYKCKRGSNSKLYVCNNFNTLLHSQGFQIFLLAKENFGSPPGLASGFLWQQCYMLVLHIDFHITKHCKTWSLCSAYGLILSNIILGSFTNQLVIERKGIPTHSKLRFKYFSSRFDPG